MKSSPPELIARYRAAGWWGDTTIYDLYARNVARNPQRLAVADPPNRPDLVGGEPLRLTYQELSARVEALAKALLRSGLTYDDIVIAQLPNVAEYVIVYLAAARLGLIVSPVPMQYGDHELNHIIGLLDPVAYLTFGRFKGANHAELAVRVSAGKRAGARVLLFGDAAAPGTTLISDLISAAQKDADIAAHVAAHPVSADDIYTICWTSGTESVPKGVPRTHNHWIAISAAHYEGAHLREGDRLPLRLDRKRLHLFDKAGQRLHQFDDPT